MTPSEKPKPSSVEDLLGTALYETAGAALVLDPNLRVVATTPGLSELFGPIDLGVSAPKQICGQATERPMAEALSRGEPMSAHISRVLADGREAAFFVRALPLRHEERLRGFLLLVAREPVDVELEAGPIEQYGIVTCEPSMKALLRDVARVAQSSSNVLVRGETGSGKELVARAIHAASERSKGPFVAINCAALPPQLLESELFGHVRGAFTGAIRDQPGLLQKAEGGTLLLDEIAELPIELQPKLLRVLEERSVIPVGGRDPIAVDIRLVSATHRSLRRAVDAGQFRADLMYRLRVIPLFIPPLRQRKNDIPLIADKLIARHNQRGKRRVSGLSQSALSLLEAYPWPGNVRELANALEYAYAIGDGPLITDADLPAELRGVEPVIEESPPRVHVPVQEEPRPEAHSAEARRILRAMERAGGHKRRAAESLGMSRTTLWRKLRELGLA